MRVDQKNISLDMCGSRRQVSIEEVRCVGIEVRQSIEALRPRALKFVTKAEIQGQPAGCVPSVAEIEGAINLLSCGKTWNYGLIKEMIFKIAEVVGVTEQKVGEGESRT